MSESTTVLISSDDRVLKDSTSTSKFTVRFSSRRLQNLHRTLVTYVSFPHVIDNIREGHNVLFLSLLHTDLIPERFVTLNVTVPPGNYDRATLAAAFNLDLNNKLVELSVPLSLLLQPDPTDPYRMHFIHDAGDDDFGGWRVESYSPLAYYLGLDAPQTEGTELKGALFDKVVAPNSQILDSTFEHAQVSGGGVESVMPPTALPVDIDPAETLAQSLQKITNALNTAQGSTGLIWDLSYDTTRGVVSLLVAEDVGNPNFLADTTSVRIFVGTTPDSTWWPVALGFAFTMAGTYSFDVPVGESVYASRAPMRQTQGPWRMVDLSQPRELLLQSSDLNQSSERSDQKHTETVTVVPIDQPYGSVIRHKITDGSSPENNIYPHRVFKPLERCEIHLTHLDGSTVDLKGYPMTVVVQAYHEPE
jgi:hypothetical protein